MHTTCDHACIPLMCKLPDDPHKVHGPGYTPDDRFVPLGSLCGYMRYVQGFTPHRGEEARHDVEVCCEVADESFSRHPHFVDEHAQCVGCGACKYPQKVADACCKVYGTDYGRDDEGRYGDYGPACKSDKPICCKCGLNKYTCIGEDDHCDESLCTDPTPAPVCGNGKVEDGEHCELDEMVTLSRKVNATDTRFAMGASACQRLVLYPRIPTRFMAMVGKQAVRLMSARPAVTLNSYADGFPLLA